MTSPPSQPATGPDERPVTVLALVAILARHGRLLVLGVLLGVAIAATWSLLVREEYTATTIFAPGDQPSLTLPGGLAALGGSLGGLPLDQGTRSPQFYTQVLTSRDLLAAVAADTFSATGSLAGAKPLSELLEQHGESPERILDNTITFLREKAIATAIDDRTGMITLTITMPSPNLAAAVANRLYHQLETFNYRMRRAGASARRVFAEQELQSARAELEAREGALRAFLEQNRGGLDMPRLSLERGRLQRRIDAAQIAFQQMTRELAEAKIAEARDTPVFTVVQRATPPLDRSFPVRTRVTILGAILGGCLMAVFVALRATSGRARAQDPEAFEQLRAALTWRRPRGSHAD
ncbi:MAG TPA: Wzz/FepE/Etk N-terminal domain-containing protein [Gemmatimonadales bacterium]|nr:Wzz/FepE/Etk N-terminal domain-containing protein [Gemmatimonadales bacterium]